MKKRISAIIASAALLLSLVSCSSDGIKSYNSAADTGGYIYSAETTAEAESAVMYDAPAEAYGTLTNESGSYVSQDTHAVQNDLSSRKIIKTATLRFETEQYDSFMEQLSVCVSSHGGYIESSEAYGGGIYNSRYSRNSSLTLRIPQAGYDSFMNTVGDLGNMTYRSENAQDVTMSYVDTESRIKAYESEYNALIEILNKAESLDSVIQLQSRISEVTYLLENYKSQLRTYDSLISYCTVRLNVDEVWRETKSEEVMSFGERISLGLGDTFREISEDVSDFTVDLIVSLPYIVIWVVIILIAVIVIKTLISRQKKKKAKMPREQQTYNTTQFYNGSDNEKK